MFPVLKWGIQIPSVIIIKIVILKQNQCKRIDKNSSGHPNLQTFEEAVAFCPLFLALTAPYRGNLFETWAFGKDALNFCPFCFTSPIKIIDNWSWNFIPDKFFDTRTRVLFLFVKFVLGIPIRFPHRGIKRNRQSKIYWSMSFHTICRRMLYFVCA